MSGAPQECAGFVSELERLIGEQARDMRRAHRADQQPRTVPFVESGNRPRGVFVNDPVHGTIGGYNHHGCRCEKCRLVWRVYQREWKRRWRARLYAAGLTARGRLRG